MQVVILVRDDVTGDWEEVVVDTSSDTSRERMVEALFRAPMPLAERLSVSPNGVLRIAFGQMKDLAAQWEEHRED